MCILQRFGSEKMCWSFLSALVYMCMFLQVFIPIYRGFERRWKQPVYQLVLTEALILHH